MQQPISNVMKAKVIELWYKGQTYRQISGQAGVSMGKISEIIDFHKQQLGIHEAESIRQLVLAMNQAGLTLKECAVGLRIQKMLSELRVDDEEFQSFIQGIYNEYKNYNSSIKLEAGEETSLQEQLLITPSKLFSITKELFRISKTEGGTGGIPLSQVPQYVKDKLNEKKEIENTLEDLHNQIATAEEESTRAVEEKEVTSANLSQYVYVRDELANNYHLSIADIPSLANAIGNCKRLGFDATAIATAISRVNSLESKERELFDKCSELAKRMNTLEKGCQFYERKLNSLRLTKKEYDELKAMGFGLNELKLLRNTLKELANTDATSAVRKFFTDLEEIYSEKLSLEDKVTSLKREIESYKYLAEDVKKRYSDNKAMSDTINILTNTRGFRHDDIIYLESIIRKYNISRSNKAKFAADLDKYGNIEEAIAASSAYLEQLGKEIEQLEIKKAELAESVDSLLAKRDAISEALEQNAKLVQAIFAVTQMEGERSIIELTEKAKEGFKISSQLLDESRKISDESSAIVSKLRMEVGEQFEAISRLEGFKDLAQIISDVYSEEDVMKLKSDNKKFIKLVLQTVRVIDLLAAAYDRLGKTDAIKQMVELRPILMYAIISLGPKAVMEPPSLQPKTSTIEKEVQTEEKVREDVDS